MQSKKQFVVVSYPWNDDENTYTGIPPHVSVMQQLESIEENQGRLIGEFVDEVTTLMERSTVGN